MTLPRRDAAALLVLFCAGLIGLAAWMSGHVDLGLTLEDRDGGVYVATVETGGIAWRSGIMPGQQVVELSLADDRTGGLPLISPERGHALLPGVPESAPSIDEIGYLSTGEWIEEADVWAEIGETGPYLEYYAGFDAAWERSRLGAAWLPYLFGIGLALFIARWGLVDPGAPWRGQRLLLASATATPLLLIPALYTGSELGLILGGLLPPLGVIPLALLMTDGVAGPDNRAWLRAGVIGATGMVALLAMVVAVGNSFDDLRELRFGLFCAALLVPAGAAMLTGGPTVDEAGEEPRPQRGELFAMAVTPVLAFFAAHPSDMSAIWPLILWLAVVLATRRFTVTPLRNLMRRTQLQRDLAVAAAEAERSRLAADLHDDALQQLTLLVRSLDESGNTDAAAEARDVATKLRAVCADLRLPILDDLGAGAALEWLVERLEPLAGGPVRLERSDASRPPANVELAVFRVAQEALANAVKHGRTPIQVRYDVSADGRVTLAIDDAGSGIEKKAAEEAPRQGHFGLLNMQQRAEQIGALLDVRRWPAGGTRVALEWRPQ